MLCLLASRIGEQKKAKAMNALFSKLDLMPAMRQEALKSLQRLTPSEKNVLQGIVLGKTSKEIARERGTSHKTVQVHRSNILLKMGVQRTSQLIRLCVALAEGSDQMSPLSRQAHDHTKFS